MNISLEYFLMVAEEESISRAAQRAMVSQQDMSNHIRRLEKQYGLLFQRKPKFVLTPVGEAVLSTYRQVRVLENGLSDRLRDLQEHSVGVIRLGLHSARARILVPPVAVGFHSQYPKVRLEVVSGDTAVFEDRLERGELNLFLGVNAAEHPGFHCTAVATEPIYFIAAESLLARFLSQPPASDVITVEQLSQLPLIFSPEISKTQSHITDFLAQNGLGTMPQIVVGDYTLQLRLAAQGLGGCFCPEMHLNEVHSLLQPPKPVLRRLSVAGFQARNTLTLVRNRRMYQPRYLDIFSAILAKEAQRTLHP